MNDVTKDSDAELWQKLFVVAAFAFAVMFVIASDNNAQLQARGALLAQSYNFTESECAFRGDDVCIDDASFSARYNTLGTRVEPYQIEVFPDGYSHIYVWDNGRKVYKCDQWFPKGTGCALYCHTAKVQDAETCEPVNKTVSYSYDVDFTLDNGTAGFTPAAERTIRDFIFNNMSSHLGMNWRCGAVYSTVRNISFNCKMNFTWELPLEQTCTPTYRNVTFGCQSGDDVRRAREVLGG